jgi:hypothetical protein
MDSKLAAYLAKQEIYELSCRYMRGLDRLDAKLLLQQFWEDGWCEYGFFNQHLIGNVLIDIEGDEAFGEVYFHAYHKMATEQGFEDMIIAGRYLDRYENRGDVWKFAYRSEVVDWSRSQPTNDPYFDLAPDCLRGSRADDAVYQCDKRRRP